MKVDRLERRCWRFERGLISGRGSSARDGAHVVLGERSADAGLGSSPQVSGYQRCCRSVDFQGMMLNRSLLILFKGRLFAVVGCSRDVIRFLLSVARSRY